MRVFVSFTGKDRELKNQLVDYLRAGLADTGDEVWESDERCASDFSHESIQAIDESQVFIVMLSAASMSPESYVISEVIEARKCEGMGNLNMMIFEVDGAEMTPRFTMNLNHISASNRVERNAGKNGLDITLRKVRRLLGLRKSGKPEKPNDVFLPELDAVVPGPVGFFVDRSRDVTFSAIDDAFGRSNVIFVSQINGYGRKSAIRKYVDTRSDVFGNVRYFPFFSGSVRDFLSDGLRIKNINESVFFGMNEREKLSRIHELLAKLDSDTLLIVPNVSPEDGDIELIANYLSDLRCRFVFITQLSTKKLSDTFPVVPVNRMEDEYLLNLFYHYYECDEADREMLREPLVGFFNSVDGHTETVELTATNMAERWGTYPEDIPGMLRGILGNMSGGGVDDTVSHISEAIRNIFDFSGFDDQEKQMLWISSLLATTPVDEKKFIGFLRDAGCFDPGKLDALAGLKWLNTDRVHHLIWMNRFPADICLSKITPDEKSVDVCSGELFSRLGIASMGMEYGTIASVYSSCAELFEHIKCPSVSEIIDILKASVFSGIWNVEISDGIKHTLEVADEECAQHNSDDTKRLYEFLKSIVLSALSFQNESPDADGQKELVDRLLNMVCDLIERLRDSDDAEIQKSYDTLLPLVELLGKNKRLMIGNFIMFADDYCDNATDDDDIDPVKMELALLCGLFIKNITDDYTILQLGRLRDRIADNGWGYFSSSEIVEISAAVLGSMCNLNICDDEAGFYFRSLIYYLSEAVNASADPDDTFMYVFGVLTKYIDMLIENGDTDDAIAAMNRLAEYVSDSVYAVAAVLHSARVISLALIENGENGRATELADKIVSGDYSGVIKESDDPGVIQDINDDIEYIDDMLTALRTPPDKGTSGSGVYESYYSQFAVQTDRASLRRYERIAREAGQIDYSGLDNERLCNIADDLRDRAGDGERQDSLAPEAFALVSEAGYRVLGYRHHYVQFLGAAAMLDGKVAEIQNGEGKTYTIPLVAFVHSLYGRQTHVLDFSDYLCARNFGWMRCIYEMLGCSVSCMTTEAYRSATYAPETVKNIANADVVYSTLETAIFYRELIDSSSRTVPLYLFRYDVLILDECDRAIECAANPHIISDGREHATRQLDIARLAVRVAKTFGMNDNYYSVSGDTVTLKSDFYDVLSRFTKGGYLDMPSSEKELLKSSVATAVYALYIAEKGRDYYVGKGMTILCEDKFDGTLKPVRPLLSYCLMIKEGVPDGVAEKALYEAGEANEMTPYTFIKGFKTVCGTSATVASLKSELEEYYGLKICSIPTNSPVIRKENVPVLYVSKADKEKAIVSLIREKAGKRQPVLVICEDTTESERINAVVNSIGIKTTLLNAKNSEDRPWALANAGILGAVTITTALANRGVDIRLGGDPAELAGRQMISEGVTREQMDAAIYSVSDDEELKKLRNKHRFLTKYYALKTEEDRRMAAELGGLCVIATCCYTDLRIEQQTIGRCGRQGCPGESYLFYALEDESLNMLIGKMQTFYSKLIDDTGIDCSPDSILGKAIKKGRLKMQKVKLGGAESTLDALCLSPHRDLFSAPAKAVRNPGTDALEIIKTVLSADENIEKAVKDRYKKRASKSSGFLDILCALKGEDILPVRDIRESLAKITVSVFEENLPNSGDERLSVLKELVVRTFNRGWSDFIKVVKQEYDCMKCCRSFEKYMSKYADKRAPEIYSETVDNLLKLLLTIREKSTKEKSDEN